MPRIHCFGNSHIWALIGGEGKNDERIEYAEEGVDLVGWKFGSSGATAFGLMKRGSDTGAGEKIIATLDCEPGFKDILMVFGEVDVSSHIGNHGRSIEEETSAAIERYAEYLRLLAGRHDTGLIMVTTVIPHSATFRGDDGPRIRKICSLWNSSLYEVCQREGFVYVDWYDILDDSDDVRDGILREDLCRDPLDPGECHLSDSARPLLIRAVLAAYHRLD